jgi:hypothetical protein
MQGEHQNNKLCVMQTASNVNVRLVHVHAATKTIHGTSSLRRILATPHVRHSLLNTC